MKRRLPSVSQLFIATLSITAALSVPPALADTVTWTHWTADTPGAPGTATGTIALGSGITVNYAGETNGLLLNYPSFNPAATFSGGTVGNAPPSAFNSVQLTGGGTYTETITFSSALTNPVMAIWSLGQPGLAASFNFTSSEPFTVQAGGPSSEYGGTSITKSGNSVLGSEGNGVIQFTGTFSELTFTTPGYENYYAFTFGAHALGDGNPPPAVPEPATLSLLGIGLGALPLLRRYLTART